MIRTSSLICSILAGLLGALAVAGIMVFNTWWAVPPFLVLHAAAAFLGVQAASRRRADGKLSVVERDAVLLAGLVAPFFGPMFSWSLVRRKGRQQVENAHQMFERYVTDVKPQTPEHERTLFTGNFEEDLARELDVETFAQVLKHGEIDQKCNAIRRLADLGEPRHLDLVRRCLVDAEQEIQLYAYSELSRLVAEFERRISQCKAEVAKRPGEAKPVHELALAHYQLAEVGVLDESASQFHFRVALGEAENALQVGGDEPDSLVIAALSHGRLGEHEEAAEVMARAEAWSADPRVRLGKCEIAYRARDFATVRAEAQALVNDGVKVPPWIEVFVPEHVLQAQPTVHEQAEATVAATEQGAVSAEVANSEGPEQPGEREETAEVKS